MKILRTSLLAVAASLSAFGAFAQASANAQRCQNLSQEVQAAFQKSVQDRVPKTDPTTFVQDGYDVKGIMSQDVTAGLGKLLSLDFSGIINSVVNKGLERASQRATATFSQRMNGVLNGVGIPSVSFQGSTTGSVATPNFGNFSTGLPAKNGAMPPANNAGNKAVGPYVRP